MMRLLPALLLVLVLGACSPPPGRDGARAAARDTSRTTTQAPAPRLRDNDPRPESARPALLAAFGNHDVVALGVLSYANQDVNRFLLDLIRDPDFADHANDIVVECGNALYQPLLDRYVGGEDVPLSDVQQVWRNTTQPFCGVTRFFEELFPLVRRVNRGRPPDRRLRVLAGDPPVDWARVRTRADLRPFMDRDAVIASVMEREVLAKHRKALMIFGARHLMHGGGGAVAMYERAGFGGRTFVIIAHNGFGNNSPLGAENAELEARLAPWAVPSLATLRGTWLGDLSVGYALPGEGGRRLSEGFDGYLYLGPRDLLLLEAIPAVIVMDSAYLAALRDRARIREGPLGLDAILREASDTSVFFNQPVGQEGPGASGRPPRRR